MSSQDLNIRNITLTRSNWKANFDVTIPKGSWASLVGPSGAGKTTLLELVAGFETPDMGSIEFNERNIGILPTAQRQIGYVFQHNALFPRLTAAENLLLALHDVPLSRHDKNQKVEAICRRVGMENRMQHRPGELSGGELARMNLARALLRPCQLLLLDEPFASLDAILRREMNGLVRELHAENKLTVLCVTHHPEDAFLFADHILVFSRGNIIANDTPHCLAHQPPTPEVASILDAGITLKQEKVTYFLRNQDLSCNPEKIKYFKNPLKHEFKFWKVAETGDGFVVVCLESGKSFLLDDPQSFKGYLVFDAQTAHRFS